MDVAITGLEQQQLREREARLHQVIDALALRMVNLADRDDVLVNGNKSELFGYHGSLRHQVESGSRDGVFPLALKRIMTWTTYVEDQSTKPTSVVPMSEMLIDELRVLRDKFQELDAILETESGLETVRMRVYALDLEFFVPALEHVLSVLQQYSRAQ